MLQRILSGWFELAVPLPQLEQHLAEQTDYVVQVNFAGLPQAAQRIAKYLAEDHPQPAAAISHLYDWLTDAFGSQLRGDWVGFLGRVQDARGLTMDQRADFVVIAQVLCFPAPLPERASGLELLGLAERSLAGGSPALLLLEIDRVEEQLAQQARVAVDRSRSYVQRVPSPPPPVWRAVAVAVALLALAGGLAALVLDKGPAPLPDQAVTWQPGSVDPGNASFAMVNVPPEAKRLVAHIELTDEHPDQGSCRGIQIALSAEPGGSTGWQPPDKPLSVAVPPGHNGLRITLRMNASPGCVRKIDTQRVEFER
ncbi:hypothetical protein ACFYST_09730 [Kitasatospora sp. NPDC004614]|uniref:hypothetical protein n=1 Tax=unclassified Kitasatospora TaxID=2633591 RepID=UPI0036C85E45